MKGQVRVNRIVRALRPYDPERIILFGSVARGDADRYSDIDVVVIKETQERFLDRLGRVYDLVQPDFAMDVLVYTPQEFSEMQARENPFVAEVVNEGIVVYDRQRGRVQEKPQPRRGGNGMRKADAEQEGRRWLKQAEYDLQAARVNADHRLFAYACFIAQQAAEKSLKAFLYGSGKRQAEGHSVGDLCRAAARINKDFADLAKRADKLDRFYIPTRYPNGLPGGIPAEKYDAEDANFALALAREIFDRAKKNLHV